MVETFLKGVGTGFSFSIFFIGPSLFALIQTSIKNGFKSALALAAGISLSDIICVMLCYFGASAFLSNPRNKPYEGIIGGGILLGFGIYTLFQKHNEEAEVSKGYSLSINPPGSHLRLMVIKGFFLNILNPFVLLFWIALMSGVHSHYPSMHEVLSFFAGMLGMVLAMDIAKSYSATRIKKMLTPALLKAIHYIMGVALIVCGLILLYDVFIAKSVSAA